MWLAIGRTALEYWYLVASGIVVVAWWSQRDTRRFEDHVDLGMSCLQAELEKFPPVLYANMHPNWSVYRKKFQQALGVACPEGIRRGLTCRWWRLLRRDHLYGLRPAEGVDESCVF